MPREADPAQSERALFSLDEVVGDGSLRVTSARGVSTRLAQDHYLGPVGKGTAYHDRHGIIVLSHPTTRFVPPDWVEVTRWCLYGQRNAGSRQWSEMRKILMGQGVTTVVSYSDPAVGHTGALYRAAGWLWAPTFMLYDPPPTFGARRPGELRRDAVKERWIDALLPDARRLAVLRPEHERAAQVLREHGEDALWREPLVRRGRIVRGTGGARYRVLTPSREVCDAA